MYIGFLTFTVLFPSFIITFLLVIIKGVFTLSILELGTPIRFSLICVKNLSYSISLLLKFSVNLSFFAAIRAEDKINDSVNVKIIFFNNSFPIQLYQV